MSTAAVRAFFMLLGTAPVPLSPECAPYPRPPRLAADLNLHALIERLPRLAADTHLCEELT